MQLESSRAALVLIGFIGAAGLTLAACSRPRDSPEKQIRDLVARGEKAAEQRDIAALDTLISESYRDEQGQDKRALLQFVGYLLLRNKSIHLFARVPTINFPEEHRAEVTALVATAGRPIDRAEDLLAINADLHRVDFTAIEEAKGEWKVVRASWRPAEVSDLE